MEITENLIRKLLDTVDAGLTSGVGVPEPGKMCVEAAISYALGEPHSDGPSCVEPAVRAGKIRLNDATWSSNEARAKGLRRVAIAQLGSKGVVDGNRYTTILAEKTIRVIVPIALRAMSSRVPTHADALEAAAVRCEQEGSLDAARAGRAAADAANACAAAYAANACAAAYAAAYAADAADAANACAAAYAAAAAAAAAAYAAAADADDAAYAAAAAAADAAYAAAADDRILTISAGLMEEALRECGSPGCDWLWLCDDTAKGGE